MSIITINYNNAVGLLKTIESVFSQTWTDFEYLIIDGNSTDTSVEIIEEYQNRIKYWISEPDTGVFQAMNKGIAKATGDYLLFLNSGDVLNGITALGDFISHKDFEGDIIYGDYQFEKGEKIYPDKLTPLFFLRTSLPHQSTFFKREVFDSMGMYDENYKIAADRGFYIKCFLSNLFVFKHIQYPITIYDLNGISNNNDLYYVKTKEDELIFKEHFGIYYEDYKKHLSLEKELARVNRLTLKGIMHRIKKRLSL